MLFHLQLQAAKSLPYPPGIINSQPHISYITPNNFRLMDICVTSGESCGHSKYCEDTTFLSSIPKDFICPLSSQLFENPVTLEADYTFERAAIANWFSQGNRTCPATGITLQNIAVPVTNLLLKHVIDGWKSEYCKSLLILANQLAEDLSDHKPTSKEDSAIMILQMLLTEFNSDEKLENAKLLVSLGGLQCLIRRFEQGEIHEKAHIAALLTCCIKADGNCRNYIARSINKLSLIDILLSDEARYRTNAVLLLVELICLHRLVKKHTCSSKTVLQILAQNIYVLILAH